MPRRRQREAQKINMLNRQNSYAARTYITLFIVHFFAVTARLRRENA